MSTAQQLQPLDIGAFASEFGEHERSPESIEDFASLCTDKGLGLSLTAMGCGTFWQMTQPLESYVIACVAKTIAASGVSADAITHILFSTSDHKLRHLAPDFARTVLERLGLVNCVPLLVSLQQCASSLTALDHAHQLFADPRVSHVVVVTFDFVVEDRERIQSFALFGDAVTSCMVTRTEAPRLSLLAFGVDVDFSGFLGKDDFMSRKRVALGTMEQVLGRCETKLGEIQRCFSTNFYKPVAMFNANICGVARNQLYIETLATRAHCGNCDWMINLMHCEAQGGLVPGKYLIQSFAPGFFACGLLEAAGG